MQYALSKKKVASSAVIMILCVVGDKNSVPLKSGDMAAAVCDNITHAFVGAITWLGVASTGIPYSASFYLQVFLCGILSSFIDLDHFLAAGSWRLKDAVSLQSRPPLHCTTVALFGCAVAMIISQLLRSSILYKLAWMLVAAFLSHHIRDSTRRGLWMWPFGSTRPVPYAAYILAEALLPHCISYLMTSLSSNYHASSFDVSLV